MKTKMGKTVNDRRPWGNFLNYYFLLNKLTTLIVKHLNTAEFHSLEKVNFP